MERLTIRNSDGSVSQPTNLRWCDALAKLAAYEDTGLDPEDVRGVKTMYDECQIPYSVVAYGADAARVIELLEADEKGRFPIMRCECDEPQVDVLPVWIPTAEQLPAVGEPVLIVRHSYNGEPVRVEPAFLRQDGRWNAMGHKFMQTNVRHWMPMPEPPKEV